MTLSEFLLARIAEDEAVARMVETAALGPNRIVHWGDPQEDQPWRLTGTKRGSEAVFVDCRRVLAECEAKRRAVVEFTSAADWSEDPDCPQPKVYQMRAGVLLDVLRLLALPYANHPDYQQEWANA